MCYGLGPQRGHARSFVAQALRADWTGYGGPFHRQTVYVNRISLYQLGSVESDSELLVSDEEIRGSDETSFARKAPNPAQRGTILPIAEAEVSVDWIENRTLNYPVGIATVEECTGELFDLERSAMATSSSTSARATFLAAGRNVLVARTRPAGYAHVHRDARRDPGVCLLWLSSLRPRPRLYQRLYRRLRVADLLL